jgi:hypothetical protein
VKSELAFASSPDRLGGKPVRCLARGGISVPPWRFLRIAEHIRASDVMVVADLDAGMRLKTPVPNSCKRREAVRPVRN